MPDGETSFDVNREVVEAINHTRLNANRRKNRTDFAQP